MTPLNLTLPGVIDRGLAYTDEVLAVHAPEVLPEASGRVVIAPGGAS